MIIKSFPYDAHGARELAENVRREAMAEREWLNHVLPGSEDVTHLSWLVESGCDLIGVPAPPSGDSADPNSQAWMAAIYDEFPLGLSSTPHHVHFIEDALRPIDRDQPVSSISLELSEKTHGVATNLKGMAEAVEQDMLRRRLLNGRETVNAEMLQVVAGARDVSDRVLDHHEKRRAERALARLEDAADEAEDSAARAASASSAAATAAGVTGERAMSHHFSEMSRREGRLAVLWQALTVASLIVLVGYSIYVTFHTAGTEELARRLSGALPILLLTGFFSREAGQRRRHSAWASVLTVQTNSLEAFVASLPTDDAQQLRAAFGQRLFLAGPAQVDHAQDEGVGVISRVADAATGSRDVK